MYVKSTILTTNSQQARKIELYENEKSFMNYYKLLLHKKTYRSINVSIILIVYTHITSTIHKIVITFLFIILTIEIFFYRT